MDTLTASVLSGLIYDGFKSGARLGSNILKAKLQGWLIDDDQLKRMAAQLSEAGIDENLQKHEIERKVLEQRELVALLSEIRTAENRQSVTQTSQIGHNVNTKSSVSIGDITVRTDDKYGK